jgi:hypothetical protein
VESLGESTHHALQLANLTSGQQYYYRVIGEEANQQSRVVGTTRSLTMPKVSEAGVVSAQSSEVIAFPSRTNKDAALFIFPRDDAGAAIASDSITLTTPEGVIASQPKKQLDYYQFDLSSQKEQKTLVTLRPLVGSDTVLESASVIFDPSYKEASARSSVQELVLDWNQRTVNFALAAVVLLFLLATLFIRLVRNR